jgi:molecular chaperone DnaK (HSP70)
MTRHIGIDFGTTSTAVAIYDGTDDPQIIVLPDISKPMRSEKKQDKPIPSIIYFEDHDAFTIGNEVLRKNKLHSPQTFRWMKTTIVEDLHDSPRHICDGVRLSNKDAAGQFLSHIIRSIGEYVGTFDSLCLTLPVHSFHNYQEWLSATALDCGVQTPMFIDEATAAAAGYSITLNTGDKFMVVDFGGGTLDISIVQKIKVPRSESSAISVLGISGTSLGGRDIDNWILQKALHDFGISSEGTDADPIINDLLINCEKAKEELSFSESSTIELFNPINGNLRQITLSRTDLENLLDDNGMFDKIEDCLRAALNQARNVGHDESEIKTVLLVGGSTLIPSVKRHFSRRFGSQRVATDKPFTAVALGASLIASGHSVDNRVFHEYAIRYTDKLGNEKFESIISPGQEFPIKNLWRRDLTATRQGQRKFNIDIFQRDLINVDVGEKSEIIFSETGIARFLTRSKKKADVRMQKLSSRSVFANESSEAGEVCLAANLDIDSHRRLLITVTDTRTTPHEVLLESSPLAYIH